MVHEKQLYTLTKNSKIIRKHINGKSINVSGKMFMEEIVDLCLKNVLLSGMKIDSLSNNQIIYNFFANKKNKMYNAHNVESVKIIIDKKNQDLNVENIKILDSLIGDTKNIVTYKACKDIIEYGIVEGFYAQGVSLGTYSSPKLTIGLSAKINDFSKLNDVMYSPNNINSFIVFDDDSFGKNESYEKQYVYKN